VSYFLIFFSAAIVNNFVLAYFLGICPFVGVSKRVSSAVSMGMAVTFVMLITAVVTWLIYHLILVHLMWSYFNMSASFWSLHLWYSWLKCSSAR
jgi:Predicted NADH:ubiquinone oxidoreductase, subunit RnfA